MFSSRIPARSLALLLPLLAPAAAAQVIQTVILEGQSVPGVGTVTLVNGLGVDDTGRALVHVLTDNPVLDKNAAFVIAGGTAVVKEGDMLASPPGALIRTFNGGELRFNAAGTPLFYLGIDPPVPSDEGLYYGTPPVLGLIETAPCTSAAVPPGTTYSQLLPGYINDANQLAFYAILDEPGMPGLFNTDAVVVISTATGQQKVLALEHGFLPGQAFETLSFSYESMAFNNLGQVIFGANTAGPSGTNNVLYMNGEKLAQYGDPSPFGGSFGQVATSKLATDLNDIGEYVFSCQGEAIVRDGEAFVAGGYTFPDIEPFQLTELGQPLFIGNNGRVLWMGLWNTPAPEDSRGIFADFNLLVEEDVTQIAGLKVIELTGLDRSYSMSPSGRYVVFEATLEGGLEGAFLIDLGS